MADDKTKDLTDGELKSKGGMNGIVLGVLSLVLIGGGLGVGLFLGGQNKKDSTEVEKEPLDTPVLVELKDIYVNVAETKGTRVLKLVPVLELSEEELKAVVEERILLVRDTISESACRMTVDELDGLSGRQTLKREIKNQLNAMFRASLVGAVKDVYFSEYLIQ